VADGNGQHVSSNVSALVGLAAAGVAVVTFLLAPNTRDIDRIWTSLTAHDHLDGHPGVLSQVAKNSAQLTAIGIQIVEIGRRIDELKAQADEIKSSQVVNQEREARMDEHLRNIGLSVPPLSDRLSTVEARMGVADKQQRCVQP